MAAYYNWSPFVDEDKEMSEKHILRRFQEEVIMCGPEATLPSNLSDYWLTEIQQSLERCFDSLKGPEEAEGEESMSLPLAAIMHILFAKSGGEAIQASLEEMFMHFEDYRIELALEEIRRKTDLTTEPATIASIFNNRKITIS